MEPENISTRGNLILGLVKSCIGTKFTSQFGDLIAAFDQQQQDLVDASSKALSYRQGVIEENVRLTYALQDAQQERTTFVSSLLPLLAEYSLQPRVSDAQSIVINIKVLFKHLQEKLIITEAKLKEAHYQLTPWQPSGMSPNFNPQSTEHSSGAAFTSHKTGLELVPQATYRSPDLANFSGQVATEWDSRGQHALRVSASDLADNSELDNVGRFSPLASSHFELHAAPTGQVKFENPVTSPEALDAVDGHHNEREHAVAWSSGTSPDSNTFEDPSSSYSPYRQPVPEEPSEAVDDDPLPAIEDLQISGLWLFCQWNNQLQL